MLQFYQEHREFFLNAQEKEEVYELLLQGKFWVFESIDELQEFDRIIQWEDYSHTYPKQQHCSFPLLVELNFGPNYEFIRKPLPISRIVNHFTYFKEFLKHLKLAQYLTHPNDNVREYLKCLLEIIELIDKMRTIEKSSDYYIGDLLKLVVNQSKNKRDVTNE